MSHLLQNKRGLIFGALDENSIAWKIAQRCMEEGAQIALTNTQAAVALGTVGELAADHQIPLILCDATNATEVRETLEKSQQILGGKLDFVLHAVAQSQNLRRHKSYTNLSYDYFLKTIDISALSLHKLIQTAMELDAIAEGGSIVTLTYIASERYFAGYNDMADAKAMLESIVRQMGAIYGARRRVRVNAISQSATRTKAGQHWKDMEYFYDFANRLSPLGAADAEDCADLCVALFSDLTRKLTMQTIYNDGGYSRTMMTEKMMEEYKRKNENENENE